MSMYITKALLLWANVLAYQIFKKMLFVTYTFSHRSL